jgi:hypothetical protein
MPIVGARTSRLTTSLNARSSRRSVAMRGRVRARSGDGVVGEPHERIARDSRFEAILSSLASVVQSPERDEEDVTIAVDYERKQPSQLRASRPRATTTTPR